MAKVTMPQLGESVAEGTIGKWLKQPGDHVDKYEPLVEVITDKVNAEVPSPFEGILREILAEEGATVPNNAEIAMIETADEGSQAPATASPAGPRRPPATAAPATTPPAPRRPAAPVAHGPAGSDERAVADVPAIAAVAAPPASADPDARMTPAVRRLLREHELSAAQVVGTGGGGRITREDVLRLVEAIRTGTAAAPAAPPCRPPRRPSHPPTTAAATASSGRAAGATPARRSSSRTEPTRSSSR